MARRWGWWRWLVARFRDPVISDRSVDLMAAAYWACFTYWGVAAFVVGIPTIADQTTVLYEYVWGGAIAMLSLVAALAALATFLPTEDVRLRIRRKTFEMVAVIWLGGFLAVYPVYLVGAAIAGDEGRVALAGLGVQYLLMPAWRSRHLYLRIKQLRTLRSPEGGEGL